MTKYEMALSVFVLVTSIIHIVLYNLCDKRLTSHFEYILFLSETFKKMRWPDDDDDSESQPSTLQKKL